MEKNRIRPVPAGKGMRMSYSRQKEVLEMPNFIEVQKNSYRWFLTDGLKEVFEDISPISDFGGHLSLEFVDFTLCEDEVKYTIPECKERDATYAAPLKVRVRDHMSRAQADAAPDPGSHGTRRIYAESQPQGGRGGARLHREQGLRLLRSQRETGRERMRLPEKAHLKKSISDLPIGSCSRLQ